MLKYFSIALLIQLLFQYSQQFSAFNSESIITFEYSYQSPVPNGKLLSFKSEATSHHNFSSLITGILHQYEFNHEFDVMEKPQVSSQYSKLNASSVEGNDETVLNLIDIGNFTSSGYVDFVKDFFQRMLTKKSEVQSCEKYFPPKTKDASNCRFYNKKEAKFQIVKNNGRQNISNYIYSSQKEEYTLQFTNDGTIRILIFNIADRVLISILIVLGFSTILIGCDIVRLYRKKNKTRNRINRLKKSM